MKEENITLTVGYTVNKNNIIEPLISKDGTVVTIDVKLNIVDIANKEEFKKFLLEAESKYKQAIYEKVFLDKCSYTQSNRVDEELYFNIYLCLGDKLFYKSNHCYYLRDFKTSLEICVDKIEYEADTLAHLNMVANKDDVNLLGLLILKAIRDYKESILKEEQKWKD